MPAFRSRFSATFFFPLRASRCSRPSCLGLAIPRYRTRDRPLRLPRSSGHMRSTVASVVSKYGYFHCWALKRRIGCWQWVDSANFITPSPLHNTTNRTGRDTRHTHQSTFGSWGRGLVCSVKYVTHFWLTPPVMWPSSYPLIGRRRQQLKNVTTAKSVASQGLCVTCS